VKAIEFFSGIGAFAEAVRNYEIDVVAAFDQNEVANQVYAHNFSLQPCNRNLDSVKLPDLPQADLWWMSPPCTPFSVRGKQNGLQDPRAASLRNLLELAVAGALPLYILIENVVGFRNSDASDLVQKKLAPYGYDFVEFELCSTQFGVPMRRPRYFLVARRECVENGGAAANLSWQRPDRLPMRLQEFLTDDDDGDLLVPEAVMQRYEQGFDIVDVNDAAAELICFTKNYERCMKASGSLLRTGKGVRRVSPEEILRLLGFCESFIFPREVNRSLRWRLLGNSVDVRAIRFIVETLGIAARKTAGVER
jgi:site-specific DNA-cytosine methylase